MNRKMAVIVGGLVFALAAVSAQTLPAGVQKMASVGGITEYDYPNGLKVLLYPDAADPKITVNVTYLVGSRHEGYGETGMAHLLEHMDFIETTNGRKIKDEIVAHAANWNGTTNDDRTNYYETVPSTDDNLKWALGLEADRMVNVKFTKQILDTEMTVVRNEFERGENNPASILRERVASTAYLWHNYGKSTIGSKEDLEKVPFNRLAEFYKKYYQPDNAVLVVTGRLDDAKTLQMIADTLGRLPRPARVLDQTYTVEPAQDGERFVSLRRVGQGQNLIVAYHTVSASHSDAAAVQVLSGVMSGGGGGGRGGRGGGGGAPDGRLAKALVDTKLAQSASMGFQLQHDPGLLQVSASLNQDQSLDAARDAIYKALDDIVKTPPTQVEVDRVKSQMLRGLENSLSNAQAIATGALNNAIAQGDWRLMFLQHDRLQAVTPADLVRVAHGGGGGGRGGGRGGGGGGGMSSATASISAPAENFQAALTIAVEILKEPLYPQDEFDRVKTQRLKALELVPTEPNQLASDLLNRHLSPFAKGDPQYAPTREEQIPELQKVTLAEAKTFHDAFYGANHGVFAVVGPVDAAQIQKTAAALLGTWNTPKTYTPLVVPFKKVAPINEKIETPDKANAEFMAGERFQLSQNDPDYAAIVLASYLFGEPITSRISDRIRNREGLSYGANARLTVPAEGDSATLSGTVSLNPGVGPKVESSFMDELRKVYEKGFTAAEVDGAKKALLDARMVGRSTDGALLNLMVSHEQLGRPLKWDADLEAKIQALTVDQVNAAFRKHIDPSGVSIVKAGDFKAAGVYR
jgi:predicted Zn-dependent peptidase